MALRHYFWRGYRWQFDEADAPEGAILDEPRPEPKPAKAPTKRRAAANKRRTAANKTKGA